MKDFQVRSGQVRSGQVRSGQVRSGQVRSGISRLFYRAVRLVRFYGCLGRRMPMILGEDASLNYLIENQCSIARYGDGEFEIMLGHGVPCQKYSPRLAQLLRETISESNERLAIGIPNFPQLAFTTPAKKKYWDNLYCAYSTFLDPKRTYLSMYISRLSGIVGLDKYAIAEKFCSIWTNRRVIYVSPRLEDAANPIFAKAKSVQMVICPPTDAFLSYDDIFYRITSLGIVDNPIVLLSVGPAATILARDLANLGYQALDVGAFPTAYVSSINSQEHG